MCNILHILSAPSFWRIFRTEHKYALDPRLPVDVMPCFSISSSSRNPKNLHKLPGNPLTLHIMSNIKWNTSIYLAFMYVACKKWNHISLKCIDTFLCIWIGIFCVLCCVFCVVLFFCVMVQFSVLLSSSVLLYCSSLFILLCSSSCYVCVLDCI